MSKIMSCIKIVFLVVAGISISLMVYAQVDCKESSASVSTSICADLAKSEADAKLNERYEALINRAYSRYIFQYQSQPEVKKAFVGKLKSSQRAWMKLRDTNCLLEGFENDWDKAAYAIELNG